MKKTWINVLLLASVTAFGLAACDNKGPAEQAGENLDESIEQVQEQSREAADDTKEALGLEEKGTMEKMGESLDETAQDIKEGTSEQVDKATKAMDDAADAADRKIDELMAEDNQ
ncbi:hypothetical protein GCM10011502_22960 [Oceanisphaera marina]|uniref:Late embryogenesis abundant protein n=1 Tax=Oceanisphaera marina TaxID=2017550 RepID=A0ABQ1IQZ0_9GAMM|nr:hypothetical protein [Oceanisphaera marina]GGB49093.1 hypothetical protein GCM10011502_22960 [Oceanisphaera marina]